MKKLVVRGTWQEMGRQVGEKQRNISRSVFDRLVISKKIRRLLEEQRAYVKKIAPNQSAWIQGFAEGSGYALEKIEALISWEYDVLGTDKCTTILGEDERGWFAAHNEDDDPFWIGKLYELTLYPKQGLSFRGIQYAGSLPGAGISMNEKGLVVSMDNISLRTSRPCLGLPMTVAGCAFLACQDWKAVMKTYRSMRVNMGMHFSIVLDSHKAASVEISPLGKTVSLMKPGFAHANHALRPHPQALRGSHSSKERQKNAEHLMALDQATVLKLLRTPVDKGGVFSNGADSVTLASVIARPSDKSFRVWD
ncbi:MAG TPA: C45 family peptidase [Patescibacteria group bacterium]|nr:C45 family peptidase [Patescibacteria group bacterium]